MMDKDKIEWLKKSFKYAILGVTLLHLIVVFQQGYFDITGYIFTIISVTICIYYTKYKNYFSMLALGFIVTIILGFVMLVLNEVLSPVVGIDLLNLKIQLDQLQFMK